MQSIGAALTMSEALSSDNGTDDPMVFDQTGTTLLHLTGNIINGAASTAAYDDEDDDGDYKGEDIDRPKKANSTQVK